MMTYSTMTLLNTQLSTKISWKILEHVSAAVDMCAWKNIQEMGVNRFLPDSLKTQIREAIMRQFHDL